MGTRGLLADSGVLLGEREELKVKSEPKSHCEITQKSAVFFTMFHYGRYFICERTQAKLSLGTDKINLSWGLGVNVSAELVITV